MDYSDFNESFDGAGMPGAGMPDMQNYPGPPNYSGPPNYRVADGFTTTGAEIQVPVDEMVTYMKNQLAAYDKMLNEGKLDPASPSPYSDPWVFTGRDQKQVQVPPQIQQMAIDEWRQEMAILNDAKQNMPPEAPRRKAAPKPKPVPRPVRERIVEVEVKGDDDCPLEMRLMWMVIGMVIMYLACKNKLIPV